MQSSAPPPEPRDDANDVPASPRARARDAAASQAEAVRFLSRADCPAYRLDPTDPPSGAPSAPRRIDTHSARLFVGESVVCKIKRAVAYSYLDMRDPATRRRLCERELEINREVLPDVYVDVVPVTRERDGTLAVIGAGEPIEWVLRMRRFEQHDVLDDVARAHRLDDDLAGRLGEAIARYHATLPSAGVRDGHARALEVVDELAVELDALGDMLPQENVERFVAGARAALRRERALLDERAASGHVRRCHGDLHLRNILLRDGRPVPFDALEFDERLATTDVLYDLAFLVMDIGHRDLPERQNRVLNAYLSHARPEELAGLALLPVFLAMRAAVRAMTTAQTASAQAASATHAAERATLAEEATRYLDAALGYLAPRRPALIAVGGLSGSGKSSLAAALSTRVARPPGAIVLVGDAERKIALGVPPLERLDPSSYTASASEANYRRLLDKAARALRAGFTVVLDATWRDAAAREAAFALAEAARVPFAGLWLEAPAATLRRRVLARRNDASDATLDVLEGQLARDDGRPDGWLPVDAGGELSTVLGHALERLAGLGIGLDASDRAPGR